MSEGAGRSARAVLLHVPAGCALDVRFGSGTDIPPRLGYVCFAPDNGHRATGERCQLSANSGHCRASLAGTSRHTAGPGM